MKYAASARRERGGRRRRFSCWAKRRKRRRPSISCRHRLSTGSALRSNGNGCTAPGSLRPTAACRSFRFMKSSRRDFRWAWPMCRNCRRSCPARSKQWAQLRERGESAMEFCKKLISSCWIGRGRSAIAVVLVMLIALGLIAPPPAKAQLGALTVTIAAAAVVSLITNTIGSLLGTSNGLLGSINDFMQALVSLWEDVVYPINLINQARAMVNQLVAQFRGLVAAIDNVNVHSATLPNPTALEAIMRNGSVADFAQFDQAFRTTDQPLPPVTDIDPGDRQRVDMSDALAMDTLKALKASDQVVGQTLQASQIIEDEAAQAAPGSAAFLTGAGLIAAVENQAMMQRMLAAELREEAAILAHTNAIRKRQADMANQFRQDTTTLFK